MITLYAVRHGETDYNKEDRVQGSHDSILTGFGRAQARALAGYFRGKKIDALYSSPLKRALETAETISEALGGLEVQVNDDFHELRCGEFEGVLFEEIKRERWEEFLTWLREPEVQAPGGESMNQLFSRVSSALKEILAGVPDGSNIAVVSHAGVVRMTLAALVGVPVGVSTSFSLTNASVSTFNLRRGRWTCHTWNDTSHLGELEGEVKSVL
ncbi:MAG TPA: histidine phosphatase family protein [Acidobacteriota bacterium]|nr:histidine phosphatase family protein [Acidobacteriota bacterium]